MGTPDVPHRVEIALWLDGRVRIENGDGRVREWTEQWQYVGGAQPEREREFLSRFDGVMVTELPGLGVARVAPGYLYPRIAGEPQAADRPIRLPDAQRRRIAENFDPDAVEQIANLLPAEERRHFLRSFGGVPGEAPAPATREQQDFAVLVRHSDPRIQALIEQMWAPWWDHEPAAALDDPNYNFPGKELAKKRRLA